VYAVGASIDWMWEMTTSGAAVAMLGLLAASVGSRRWSLLPVGADRVRLRRSLRWRSHNTGRVLVATRRWRRPG
jgi:hypothetical protein